ncbi:RAD55 family ATPase [Aggregicoccus sp. 17bor-14]|uniref:RAD55 family ATPase n=1 Tax=Myxococcaceae TaxID=31 RepID=UPI00351A35A4
MDLKAEPRVEPRAELTERVHTGVPGLDAVLGGGLLRGGVYIVTGTPGTGKTLLANQVAFAQAREGGRCLYVTLLAESHARMMAYLRPLAFFDPERVPHDVYYVSAFRTLEEGGLAGLLELLRRETRQHGTRLLVLDGLIQAEETAGSAREFKKFVHELQTFSDLTRCTVLLLTHPHTPDVLPPGAGPQSPEQTMVDGILELRQQLGDGREAGARSLTVRKFRGSATLPGSHLLSIRDSGVRVWPRLEACAPRTPPPGDGSARVHLGVPSLDAMLPEGVSAGSLTLVLGASGAGKTLLGLHFLAEGLARGEPGLLFNFEEPPLPLQRKAQRLGLQLGEGFAHLWQAPVDDTLDALAERLLEAVERLGTRRLVLDGLGGLQAAEGGAQRLGTFLPALVQVLRHRGVTTLLTAPSSFAGATGAELPVLPAVSGLADNAVVLRLLEHHAHTRRLVSVLKVRDAGFDAAVREFRIGARGLEVSTPLEGSEALLAGLTREPSLPAPGAESAPELP